MVLLAFILSFIFSLVCVPLVRRISLRLGRVVQPRKDRWNNIPTPTLGGIAMFFVFIISVLVSSVLTGELGQVRWALLAGSVLMFGMGLFDDFKRITPPTKLVGQILAAAIVVYFIDVIHFFPWGVANIILTFVWLVGITNAINLLDNMDGLAGGVALIAAGVLSYFFWRTNNQSLLLISLSLVGSILGFLVFNFPPAKIFMGDSGSMFLGFTLAALSVARRTQASNILAVTMVPTLLFLLPIIDTALVTITRLLRGQSPAQGGADHTSHRLVAFGLTERQAVLFLYGIAIVSGVAAAGLEALDYALSLVLIPILLISLALFTAYLGRLKVVSTLTPSQGSITRLMVNLTYKRRLFEIVLDFFLIGVSYYLAYWIRFGLTFNQAYMNLYVRSVPLALATAYFAFFILGVYRGAWRYVGVDDLVRYATASLGAVIPVAVLLKIIYPTDVYSLEIFILYAVFLFFSLAASRSSFQVLDRISGRQITNSDIESVLIYGAEDAGEIALRWIIRNPELGYRPIGFLDDDPLWWGRHIHGVDILGGCEQLENILSNKHIDGIIISSSSRLSSDLTEKTIAMCHNRGVWVKVLRLEFELIE